MCPCHILSCSQIYLICIFYFCVIIWTSCLSLLFLLFTTNNIIIFHRGFKLCLYLFINGLLMASFIQTALLLVLNDDASILFYQWIYQTQKVLYTHMMPLNRILILYVANIWPSFHKYILTLSYHKMHHPSNKCRSISISNIFSINHSRTEWMV